MNQYTILTGDCLEQMRKLPDCSVHSCVTSPPYFGLRDYGHAGQIGLEEKPDVYVAKLVDVFREVRRVLRDDGTLWLNLGDSYASASKGSGGKTQKKATNNGSFYEPRRFNHDVKDKDLIGIPWRVAFALQADGWWLRQDIIWHKPNPMPESITDRCTKAHEYIFLLSKSAKYYFDSEAIKEDAKHPAITHKSKIKTEAQEKAFLGRAPTNLGRCGTSEDGKINRRSVWTVTTKPFKGAHFATFPPNLIRPCILAGCPKGGLVLDPFGGSGTTAAVAIEEGRNSIICELNPEYVEIAIKRIDAASKQHKQQEIFT
jgi:site-specific DNA-methyltransferase (adenine-specific)